MVQLVAPSAIGLVILADPDDDIVLPAAWTSACDPARRSWPPCVGDPPDGRSSAEKP
jgi:hypothetical protein